VEKVTEISISVPSAVLDAVDRFRAECTKDGGKLELDGDEISKLYTDQGEDAYVIQAAFTCNDRHVWCGSMGCPTGLVINNKFYDTNMILRHHPNRISKLNDGTIAFWIPEGLRFVIGQ
jgi:hypothetical protein